jgi:hypothetical protein
MRWPHVIAATGVALVLSSTSARADYTTIAPVRPLTMADLSGLTSVGLDLQLTHWTEHPPAPADDIDFTSLTFDLAADIRLAPHWMVLARLPLSHVGVDGDPAAPDCCDFALGNLTLGGRGLWATLIDGETRAVSGGELTVSLPTASDGGESARSAAAAAFAHLPRDPGLYGPNTTTVRLTSYAQVYGRWFLAQVEAGLHLYFYDSDVPGDDRSDAGVRLALAGGFRATYKIAILAEINSLFFFSDKFATDDDTVTSLDLGVRYGSGRLILGLRAYLPLDPTLRDLGMIGVGLDGGARF